MTARTSRAAAPAPETPEELPDSGSHETTLQAWVAVMAEVQGISKASRNTQQNFNFRGIDAVMNAVGPALRKHGVAIVPVFIDEVTRNRYATDKGTSMVGTVVRVTYAIHGPSGSISGQSIGEASDAGDKGITKAMSVAYRTFLLQALTIPTDEPDPDSQTHTRGALETAVATAAEASGRGPALSLDAQTGYDKLGEIAQNATLTPAAKVEAVAEWRSRAEDLGIVNDKVVHNGRLVTLGSLADKVASDAMASA